MRPLHKVSSSETSGERYVLIVLGGSEGPGSNPTFSHIANSSW